MEFSVETDLRFPPHLKMLKLALADEIIYSSFSLFLPSNSFARCAERMNNVKVNHVKNYEKSQSALVDGY